MDRISFIIPGKPRPQERPFVKHTGQAFDRKNSRLEKIRIAQYGMLYSRGWKKTEGPIGINALFFGANPNADVDNLYKLAIDGLRDFFWENDRQIIDAHIAKRPAIAGQERIEIDIFKV